MPYQPVDFSAFANYILQQQQQNKPPDIMERFKKGYSFSDELGQAGRKREEEELANAFNRMKNEQYPEETRIANELNKIKLQQAQNPAPSYDDMLKQLQIQNYISPADMERLKSSLSRQEQQQKFNLEQQKPKDEITPTTKTANQTIIQAVDNTLPLIQKLSALDWGPSNLNPVLAREADTLAKTVTETLMGALNLPSTTEGIKVVKGVVERKWGETAKQYSKRLEKVAVDLVERRQRAEKTLESGKLYEGKEDAIQLLEKMGVGKGDIKKIFGSESKVKDDPMGLFS